MEDEIHEFDEIYRLWIAKYNGYEDIDNYIKICVPKNGLNLCEEDMDEITDFLQNSGLTADETYQLISDKTISRSDFIGFNAMMGQRHYNDVSITSEEFKKMAQRMEKWGLDPSDSWEKHMIEGLAKLDKGTLENKHLLYSKYPHGKPRKQVFDPRIERIMGAEELFFYLEDYVYVVYSRGLKDLDRGIAVLDCDHLSIFVRDDMQLPNDLKQQLIDTDSKFSPHDFLRFCAYRGHYKAEKNDEYASYQYVSENDFMNMAQRMEKWGFESTTTDEKEIIKGLVKFEKINQTNLPNSFRTYNGFEQAREVEQYIEKSTPKTYGLKGKPDIPKM